MILSRIPEIIPAIIQNGNWVYMLPSVLLNMTLTGGVAILVVLLLRLMLKKVPKTIAFLLWIPVLFRLLCPVSFSLPVSLYQIFDTDIRDEAVIEYVPVDIVHTPYPQVSLPAPESVNDAINDELPYGVVQLGADPLEWIAASFVEIWLVGAAVVLLWNLIGYLILRFRLRHAVKLEKGIYETDMLDTAIVTGLILCRIYVPEGLDDNMHQYVIEHERQHIRRLDPWFRFLFFLALCIHWYNPLVWIGFRFAVRDMEMACDEGVLRHSGEENRQQYAATLLSVTAGRTIRISSPLAFGEHDVKARIRNVLAYTKRAKWIAAGAFCAVLLITVVLASNPVKPEDVYEASYKVAGTLNYQEMTAYEPYRVTVTENKLIVTDDGKRHLFTGQLVEQKSGFPAVFEEQFDEKNKRIKERYRASAVQGECYLAVTAAGEVWLAVDWPNYKSNDDGEGARGIYLLEPNREEPDELYFLAMIETGGGPRAQLMETWQTEKFLTGETWYIVSYRMQGPIQTSDGEQWQMGYATFCMKDGQYEMTANRRYYMEEKLPGVMICDDPASLAVDYNLAKESYEVIFVLDDSVKQVDQTHNGRELTRVWLTSAPKMLVLPYEKEGISYKVTYEDGGYTEYSRYPVMPVPEEERDETAVVNLETLPADEEFRAALEAKIRETTLPLEYEDVKLKIELLDAQMAQITGMIQEKKAEIAAIDQKIADCEALLEAYDTGDENMKVKMQKAVGKLEEDLAQLRSQREKLTGQTGSQAEIAAIDQKIADCEAILAAYDTGDENTKVKMQMALKKTEEDLSQLKEQKLLLTTGSLFALEEELAVVSASRMYYEKLYDKLTLALELAETGS